MRDILKSFVQSEVSSKFRILLFAAVSMSICACSKSTTSAQTATVTLYASPTGSGSTCSLSSPCSLTGARNQVRTMNASMTGDIEVSLMGGTYTLTSTFELDPKDSGENGNTVIYDAYDGQTPVLSGGQTITGWTQVDTTKNIWQATAPGLQTRQLYINGKRAIRARSTSGIPGTVTQTSTGYTTNATFTFAVPSDLEFVYTGTVNSYTWVEDRCGVSSITTSGGTTTITMNPTCWSQTSNWGVPTYYENANELVASAGQWYLNETTGVISYIPRSGETMSTASVVAPVLEMLMLGNGTTSSPVHDIQISGLTFAYSTWLYPSTNHCFYDAQANQITYSTTSMFPPGGVAFHTGQNLKIQGNSFWHIGSTGLVLDTGAQGNTIQGNLFTDISSSAVRIGDILSPNASSSTQDTWNNVTNNYVYQAGVEYGGAPGMMAGFVSNTTFSYNELEQLPNSGISMGWGWSTSSGTSNYMSGNKIFGNAVHDYMQKLVDGGGIYTLGKVGSSSNHTVIHDNYIYNQTNLYAPLYPDQGSAYLDIYNNVVVAGTLEWLHIWTSSIHDVNVYNNFSDTSKMTNAGTNISLSNNSTAGTPWSSGAESVIGSAGLQSNYTVVKGWLNNSP